MGAFSSSVSKMIKKKVKIKNPHSWSCAVAFSGWDLSVYHPTLTCINVPRLRWSGTFSTLESTTMIAPSCSSFSCFLCIYSFILNLCTRIRHVWLAVMQINLYLPLNVDAVELNTLVNTAYLLPLPSSPASCSSQCTLAALWASGGKQLIDIDWSISTGHQRSFDSPAAREPLGEHQSSAGWKGYLRAWMLIELIYTSISWREAGGLLLPTLSWGSCVFSRLKKSKRSALLTSPGLILYNSTPVGWNLIKTGRLHFSYDKT